MAFFNFNSDGYYFRKKAKRDNLISLLAGKFNSTQNHLFPNKLRFKHHHLYLVLFLSGWFCINMLQSIYTQIANDEAYYWMYAQFPAWGYFDHPPMIAFMIKLGSFLLPGEPGVRIMIILAQLLSIILIWKMTDEDNPSLPNHFLFFGIAAAIPLFQIYGFIATPDAALLLFICLFLFSYRKFLHKESFWNILLLGISMAGLMYSKYHGVLVILFTIISNWKLLLRNRFWASALLAAGLLIPHMAWQLENGFPTFQFQMMERMASFNLTYFLEYWVQQFFAFNPLILVLLAVVCFRSKPATEFEKSLYFIVAGFFLFFWTTSLWTRPEPHWTAAASIPAIILLYKYAKQRVERKKFIYRFVFPTILLLVTARLAVIFHFLPFETEFYQQKEWATKVANTAGTLPVVFTNSYQKPSVYSFYTGNVAFSLNSIFYRKNQYDIWEFEEEYQGKKVAVYQEKDLNSKKEFSIRETTLHSYQKINIRTILPNSQISQDESTKIFFEITNPYPYPVRFDKTKLSAVYISGDDIKTSPVNPAHKISTLQPGKSFKGSALIEVSDLLPGDYHFALCLKTPLFAEAFNSEPLEITIIPPTYTSENIMLKR